MGLFFCIKSPEKGFTDDYGDFNGWLSFYSCIHVLLFWIAPLPIKIIFDFFDKVNQSTKLDKFKKVVQNWSTYVRIVIWYEERKVGCMKALNEKRKQINGKFYRCVLPP